MLYLFIEHFRLITHWRDSVESCKISDIFSARHARVAWLSPVAAAFLCNMPPFRWFQERKDKKFRLALGSFLEEYNNRVEIVTVRSLAATCPKFVVVFAFCRCSY